MFTRNQTLSKENSNKNNEEVRFRPQKLVEAFLRETHLLKLVEGSAEKFVRTFQQTKRSENALSAVIVTLDFTYSDLVGKSIELLHFAIEEPVHFEEAVKYCVYGIIRDFVKQKSADSGLSAIDIAQVHIRGRFIGLPLQRNLQFEPSARLFRNGLSLVYGILSAYTTPETIVVQSIWYCGTGCIRNVIQQESTEAPLCTSCSRPMSEYQKLRVTENYRLLSLLPVACIETPRTTNRVFHATTVRLLDHKYNCDLKLGGRYLVTGYYNYNRTAAAQ